MKLYVIRHGKTPCNTERLYNCRHDEDINELGVEQAKEASKIVKDLPIDLIICSPLLRARHTMEIINVNNLPCIIDEGLLEREGGEMTLAPISEEVDIEYNNYYSTMEVKGLESLPHLFERVHAFVDKVKLEYPNKNILFVTHNLVARAIKYYFEPIPEDGLLSKVSGQKNCEIVEYEL